MTFRIKTPDDSQIPLLLSAFFKQSFSHWASLLGFCLFFVVFYSFRGWKIHIISKTDRTVSLSVCWQFRISPLGGRGLKTAVEPGGQPKADPAMALSPEASRWDIFALFLLKVFAKALIIYLKQHKLYWKEIILLKAPLHDVFNWFYINLSSPHLTSGSKWQQTWSVHWRLFSTIGNINAHLKTWCILRKSPCGTGLLLAGQIWVKSAQIQSLGNIKA